MTNSSPFQKFRPIGPAVVVAATYFLLVGTLSAYCFFMLAPATGWHNDHSFTATPIWLFEYLTQSQKSVSASIGLLNYVTHPNIGLSRLVHDLTQFDLASAIASRAASTLVAAFLCGIYVFKWRFSTTEYIDRLTHVDGRLLVRNRAAPRLFSLSEKKASDASRSGIELSPGASLSIRSESEHFLLVGATGAGKTTVIRYLANQILKQNAKVLFHDSKGDLTATLPTTDFVLLAPHDARSVIWDIGRDCRGPAAARELAAALIPMSSETMWTNGSRMILAGIIIHLQQSSEGWGWAELSNLVFSPPEQIRQLLEVSFPPAAQFIEVDTNSGAANRTSYGFLVGLWAAAGQTIAPLAAAWPSSYPRAPLFSLTDWVSDSDHDNRPIVLQRSAQMPELSAAWTQAAVTLLSNFVSSSAFPDNANRRIWFILDELAQLQKISGLEQLLAVGRSKGVRCVLGVQDLEQIAVRYGEKELKAWLSIIGTKIVGRMNSGPSARFMSETIIGSRRVTWQEVSHTRNSSKSGLSGFDVARSVQTRTEVVPAVEASELENELGLKHYDNTHVIRSIVLKHGRAYVMNWPLSAWPDIRPAVIDAAWVSGE